MFIGILLILTWLVLLLRYPAKALPISMAALLGLGLVGLWVVWLDNREASQLARLELRLDYAPDAVTVTSGGKQALFNAFFALLGPGDLLMTGGTWDPHSESFQGQVAEQVLRSYDFDNMDGGGWLAWRNSLQLAFCTAVAGTAVVFTGAWMVEKVPARGALARGLRGMVGMLALVPMAVPGLVLGLGYIFFFNSPLNPLNVLYGTMPLLVLCTVVHFYTSAHLTAATALNALDPEFEAASASLKVPRLTTFLRVTLPMCLPAALDVARYLFVSAMTTVSAVVFLYSPSTVLAAVAVLNMDDSGNVGGAAAMSTLILLTSAAVSLLLAGASRGLLRRSQAWRKGANP